MNTANSNTPQCPFSTAKYHVITDPHLVRVVLRDENLFAPTNALESHHRIHPKALRELHRVGFALPPVLANQTGRKHRKVRQLLATLFTKRQVSQWQPRYTDLVNEALDTAAHDFQHNSDVDLALSVTGLPPTRLLLELMMWPTADIWSLKAQSDAGLELFWGEPTLERQQELAKSCADLYEWLRDEAVTGYDALSQTLAPAKLSRKELLSLAFFLSIAGHQTTTYLANTALHRCLSPTWTDTPTGQSDKHHCPKDLDVWATDQTQSVLRTHSSVHTWRRQVTSDTTLGDVSYPAGSQLLLHLTGHHDESNPGQQHTNTPHEGTNDYQLAFGLGPHRCLGAELAMMEVATILTRTRQTFPELTLSSPSERCVDLLSFRAPLSVWCQRSDGSTQVRLT